MSFEQHGTGFAESEAFMDVVVLFDRFKDGGPAPDFDPILARLAESFNDSELRDLDIITRTLLNLITRQLVDRGLDNSHRY